jgi:hypothetical protein
MSLVLASASTSITLAQKWRNYRLAARCSPKGMLYYHHHHLLKLLQFVQDHQYAKTMLVSQHYHHHLQEVRVHEVHVNV